MASLSKLRDNLVKSLWLKMAMPAFVVAIIAIGVTGAAYLWTQDRAESYAEEVRLHDEAMIALELMQKEAQALQFATHEIIEHGDEALMQSYSDIGASLDAAHELSQQKHIEAELEKADAESEQHVRLDQLYNECQVLHTGIKEEVLGLIESGTVVAGIGAPGIDRESMLANIDADFSTMNQVDSEIEQLLGSDREQTVAEQKDASATARSAAVFAGGLALLAGLGIAAITSRKLVAPVRSMVGAAHKMADGDMSQEVRVRGSDELARLGKTFNTMAKALEQRTQQLEHEKSSMRSIHQSIGDGIVVLGSDGMITSLNPAAEKALGQNAIDLEGKREIGVARLQAEIDRPRISQDEMLKCWEVKNCTHPECPSYGSSDRRCWLQCGTHCYNQIQGTFRQKRDACERCDVFQANAVRQLELTIDERRFSCAIIPVLDDMGQQEGRTLVLHDITAIHNAKQELEKHSAELEDLQVLTNAVSGSLNLEETLGAGVRKIYDGGEFDAVAIYLRDKASDGLTLACVQGFEEDSPEDLWHLEGRTAPARALENGEPIIIDDLRQFKRCPDSLRQAGILSAAILPLRTQGSGVLGILCAGRKKLEGFDRDGVRLLKLMAAQISIAARNAMLYEEKVRYSRKVQARNRIVSTLTSSLDLDEVFDAFAAETRKLVAYEHMSIIMMNDGGNGIERIVTFGGCPMRLDDGFPWQGSVMKWIAENRQTVVRGDLPNEKQFSWDSALVASGVNSAVNIPLIVEDKIIGTLNFCSKDKEFFREDIVEELKPIADQLALALANQGLFQHVTRAKVEWEKTFDAVGEGIVVVNEDHEIVRLNHSAAEMLGASVEELTGASCREHLHHLLTSSGKCALEGAEPGNASTQMESELPDGRILEVTIDSVFDDESRFSGGVHFLRDITESKQMRQRMMTSEKMVAVGQLVSGVAHEINNPLTGITGYAQLLMMRDDLDEKTRRDAEAIAAESERATRIVRQLLSFARKHQPERQPVSINNIVKDSIGLKGYDLKVNDVEIVTDFEESLPEIAVDQHQIQQVFINLITNAEQAIHENGKGGVLEISTRTKNDRVRIAFADDGPGVPAEIRNRLFDPFYTTKDVGKGTGLGLSVCFGIVQEHDGSIWAENREEDRGAVFTVELPVTAGTRQQDHEMEATETAVTGRLLLVDDETSVREVLSETLRRVGHKVDTAENGEEALRLLGENEYDCVVSDVKMPVMNGAELHLAVKSVNPQAAERFIFISGDIINEETRRYLESVPNPSLDKPFTLQDLEAVLNHMLGDDRKAA